MAASKSKSSSPNSGGDIPFKSKSKTKTAPEPEEDGEEEEEEYAVEKIITHKWVGKGKKQKLIYSVKWVGWDETTDEPEENLDNCPEELDTYFKMIGGKPEPPSTPGDSKKRSVSETATPTGRGRPVGANKKARTDDTSSVIQSVNGNSTFKVPQGSWEDHIMAIDSMDRDETGDIIAYIVWNSKQKTRHSTKLLNQKCPQKLLQFYEAHLFFNRTPEDEKDVLKKDIAPVPTSPATKDTQPGPLSSSDRADEDDEMADVKAVASGA